MRVKQQKESCMSSGSTCAIRTICLSIWHSLEAMHSSHGRTPRSFLHSFWSKQVSSNPTARPPFDRNGPLTGGPLNRVVHLWEYDSFDHRTEVRKALAGDKGESKRCRATCCRLTLTTTGFVDYFSTIRPWLATQTSVMLDPESFDESASGPFFSITVPSSSWLRSAFLVVVGWGDISLSVCFFAVLRNPCLSGAW